MNEVILAGCVLAVAVCVLRRLHAREAGPSRSEEQMVARLVGSGHTVAHGSWQVYRSDTSNDYVVLDMDEPGPDFGEEAFYTAAAAARAFCDRRRVAYSRCSS